MPGENRAKLAELTLLSPMIFPRMQIANRGLSQKCKSAAEAAARGMFAELNWLRRLI